MPTAPKKRHVPPLILRQLQAQRILKNLSLETVAKRAGVNESVASELLNGRRVHPERLARLRKVIESAPMPTEAAL